MNKLSAIKNAVMILALGAGMMVASAQTTTQPQKNSWQANKHEQMSNTGRPTKAEKASGLIGMDVKNPQGQKLGEIKDVVFNFKEDDVAYCVLGEGGGFFGGQKLLALPMSAFQPSANGKYLILHATKANLAAAKGFSENKWPSVNSQHPWGAQPFWKNDTWKSKE